MSEKFDIISQYIKTKIARASAVTDAQGEAEVTVKVPGAFNGFNGYVSPLHNGRYLIAAQALIESGELGDLCISILVKDLDGVIPEPYRAQFPAYPILGSFSDTEQAPENQGWHIWPGTTPTRVVRSGDPSFVPAGCYVVGAFKLKTATPDRLVCVNYEWAKAEGVPSADISQS